MNVILGWARAHVLMAALAWGLGACSSDPTYQTAGANGGSGTTKGTCGRCGNSGNATTTGGASAGSGSGTSTATGTTGSSSCPITPITTLNDCPSGMNEIRGTFEDILTSTPITTPLQFTDILHPSASMISGACGQLVECVTPPYEAALEITSDTYQNTIVADISVARSNYYNELALAENGLFTSELTTLKPMFVPAQPVILIKVQNRGSRNCSAAGWQLSAVPLDGGAMSGIVRYLSGTSIDPNLDSTGPSGLALIYNVDSSLDVVQVLGTQIDAGWPDDAGPCAYDGGPDLWTGTIHVRQTYYSLFPYQIY